MEPENPTPAPHETASGSQPIEVASNSPQLLPPPDTGDIGLRWVFLGPNGLRAGWSVAIFFALLYGFGQLARLVQKLAHVQHTAAKATLLTPRSAFTGELIGLVMIIVAAWIVAKIERRPITDYYLRGPGRVSRFFSGLVTGFLALSAMVGGLVAGGWMHISGLALDGRQMLLYAAAWGGMFLLVGCAEEGLARCFLLFTLARGLNFWWSLGLVAFMCALVTMNHKANGLWGVYVIALLGLVPCLMLHLNRAPGEGFWNAAWVTSVMFGAGHTGNGGENWVGIFSAAGIGFVFCVSVRVTGSVWWAIGCHAAWDWAESFFYGTPDSGLLAQGHLLNSAYSGSVLWSGGSDGPEGSILVIPIMLLILLVVLIQYGHRRSIQAPAQPLEQVNG